jgi:hypothetical protein
VTAAEKLDREEDTSVYQAQVLSYLEGAGRVRASHLGEAEVMKDSFERSILETREHRLKTFSATNQTFSVINKGVFDLMRLVSLGKSICKHFDIPLDEDAFPPDSDGEETKGNP